MSSSEKQAAALLIDMPDEICAAIVAKWISLSDLVHIDTAVCNHMKRVRWLHIIQQPLLSLPLSSSKQSSIRPRIPNHFRKFESNSFIKWLTIRGVKIDRLEFHNAAISQEMLLHYLEQHGSHVLEIVMGKDFECDDASLSVISHFTTGLERLHIGPNKKITDIAFSYISDYCPQLKQFSYTHDQNGCVSLDFICRFMMRRLQKLTLKDCALISTDQIISLMRNCRNLEELTLINCTWSTSASNFDSPPTTAAKLRKLTLRACRCLVLPSIVTLLKTCKELEEFYMQHSRLLSSNVPLVADVDDLSPNDRLSVFDVTGTSNIDNAAFLTLIGSNCGLRKLSLRGQRWNLDETLRDIGTKFISLESIDLADCTAVSDSAVSWLVSQCVNLTNIDMSENTYNISDTSLMAIAAHLPNLASLALENNQRITTDGVISISRGVGRMSLKYLNLNGCDQVSDRAVVQLARGCPSLEVLHLAQCHGVSDISVRAWIEALQASRESFSTDSELKSHSNVQSMQRLRCKLHIQGCRRVSYQCTVDAAEAGLIGIDDDL